MMQALQNVHPGLRPREQCHMRQIAQPAQIKTSPSTYPASEPSQSLPGEVGDEESIQIWLDSIQPADSPSHDIVQPFDAQGSATGVSQATVDRVIAPTHLNLQQGTQSCQNSDIEITDLCHAFSRWTLHDPGKEIPAPGAAIRVSTTQPKGPQLNEHFPSPQKFFLPPTSPNRRQHQSSRSGTSSTQCLSQEFSIAEGDEDEPVTRGRRRHDNSCDEGDSGVSSPKSSDSTQADLQDPSTSS